MKESDLGIKHHKMVNQSHSDSGLLCKSTSQECDRREFISLFSVPGRVVGSQVFQQQRLLGEAHFLIYSLLRFQPLQAFLHSAVDPEGLDVL